MKLPFFKEKPSPNKVNALLASQIKEAIEARPQSDRAMKRRAFNSWRKFKKKSEKLARRRLGSYFVLEAWEREFDERFPNPMEMKIKQKGE